ncbi:MAG: AAA family ATPase, partial [Gemmatimonadota bacterium]
MLTGARTGIRDDGDVTLLEQLTETRSRLETQVARRIVGQTDVIEKLLVALLAGGHALVVGVPGLAKTTLIATLAETLELQFRRIQFTPDLMPSDITGTDVMEEDH